MRQFGVNSQKADIIGTITVPDVYIFAFNPNYVEFDVVSWKKKAPLASATAQITVTAANLGRLYTIDVALYNGTCKAYISRIIQMCFADVLGSRSNTVFIAIVYNGVEILRVTSVALWSALQIGEQFGRYGVYVHNAYNNGVDHVRETVWFPAFPFKVSLFRSSEDEGLTVDVDGARKLTNQTLTATGIFEVIPSEYVDAASVNAGATLSIGLVGEDSKTTFTNVFDYTFTGVLDTLREKVNLHIDNSTRGYYLRWIDQFGFLQYFLFVKGERTSKNKLSSNELDYEQQYNGMYFGNITRVQQVTSQDTVKCSAVNLTERVLAYVETIVKSAYVDLYLGKDKYEQEIWLPVNIVSGSYKVEANKVLRDYEISFTLPETTTQSL